MGAGAPWEGREGLLWGRGCKSSWPWLTQNALVGRLDNVTSLPPRPQPLATTDPLGARLPDFPAGGAAEQVVHWEWRPALHRGFRVRPRGLCWSFAAFQGRVASSLPKKQQPRKQTSKLVNHLSAEELEGLGPCLQLLGTALETRTASAGEVGGAGAGLAPRSASGSFHFAVSSGCLLGNQEQSPCRVRWSPCRDPSLLFPGFAVTRVPIKAQTTRARRACVPPTSPEGGGAREGVWAWLRLFSACCVVKASTASPLLPSVGIASSRALPSRAASAASACGALIVELVRRGGEMGRFASSSSQRIACGPCYPVTACALRV